MPVSTAGASLIEYAGWSIADHYGNPVEEHRAVRNAVGLIDLSHRGKIKVEGEDRTTFLHAMLSNDVKGLKKGEGFYAMMLNAQAHILADLYLYAFDDHFLIDCSASLTKKIIETLEKYIVMEKVTLKDRTGDFTFLCLEGRKAEPLVTKIIGEGMSHLKANFHETRNVAGTKVEIFRCSISGEDGFAFLAPTQAARKLWDHFLEEGKAFDLRPFGRAAANTLRIEAGIPWYGLDMDERNLLPETGLGHAVSYTKGCYIGQEVVARLDTYGQVNKKLMGLEIGSAEIPQAESKIVKDGKEVGYLTSACHSPTLDKTIGLGYIHRDGAKIGSKMEIKWNDKKVQARVVELPFVSSSRT